MKKKLTKLQAYNAMLYFLKRQYDQNKSEYIGDILSNCQFWPHKRPGDPAAWHDWNKAIQMVQLQDKKLYGKKKLNLKQACCVMFNFIDHYASFYTTIPEDLINLLKILQGLKDQQNLHNQLWKCWVSIVEEVMHKDDPRMYLEFELSK